MVDRPQRLARARAASDFSASSPAAWPSVSLSFLKLSMSISADRQTRAVALRARAFGLERLRQAAPVGDLRQRVGRHFVRQAAQFALELAHAALELAGACVLVAQALARAIDDGLHRARLGDHLPHHAGQALQRVGVLDGLA